VHNQKSSLTFLFMLEKVGRSLLEKYKSAISSIPFLCLSFLRASLLETHHETIKQVEVTCLQVIGEHLSPLFHSPLSSIDVTARFALERFYHSPLCSLLGAWWFLHFSVGISNVDETVLASLGQGRQKRF